MRHLLEDFGRFKEMNCEVVLIASQPSPPIAHFVEQEKLPFKILSDADRRITRQCGIYQPIGLMGVNVARPSAFLMDSRGLIIYQYVGSATDRPPLEEVLQVLSKMSKDGVESTPPR